METESPDTGVILDGINTNIPVTKMVRERLRKLGSKGETYSVILTRLMDDVEPTEN